MGQKVSSLGAVLSGKNNSPDCSPKNCTESSAHSPRTGRHTGRDSIKCTTKDVAEVVSNKTDQQLYENIRVSEAEPSQPDTSIGVDSDCARCNDDTSTDAETTSKNSQTSSKSNSGSKKLNQWVLRFSCSRPKWKSTSKEGTPPLPTPVQVPAPMTPKEEYKDADNNGDANVVTIIQSNHSATCQSCICSRNRRTEDDLLHPSVVFDPPPIIISDDEEEENSLLDYGGAFGYNQYNRHRQIVLPSFDEGMMELNSDYGGEEFMTDDFEDRAYKERAKEIQEGIEPPPGFRPGLHIQLLEFSLPKMTIDNLTSLFHRAAITAFTAPHDIDDSHRIHTSIDYIHYLVPDLLQITNCSFYWGKMDRYEAEKLLESRPEGTFLLRDSAQEEYLFSVSFRKYGRSLHARIEQWNHLFSFDSRDPGVFASSTVCGLLEHYKDPTCCMFFEPMLTIPLNRNFTFSLQHTCRATICSAITYDDVNQLKLPKLLRAYLKEYHYKQRVRVRIFDSEN